MISWASPTTASGPSVTGSTIIPDSERFTLSTSATWSATDRFRWTTPMPPARAIAMASGASVTVSIAAERIGTFSPMPGTTSLAVDTSFGRTLLAAGRSRTSSKVRPSVANLAGWFAGTIGSVLLGTADRSPRLSGPTGTQGCDPVTSPAGRRCAAARQGLIERRIWRAIAEFIW